MTLEKFHYPVKDAKGKPGEITLPRFANLPFGVIRKIRNLPAEEAVFALFEELLKDDPKTLAQIDLLDGEQVADMQEKWQEDSQVSLGESKAS